MPTNKKEIKYVKKSITVTQEQDDFIQQECLNLSKFVQQKIREKMK